jgi:hypothetical protein
MSHSSTRRAHSAEDAEAHAREDAERMLVVCKVCVCSGVGPVYVLQLLRF